MDPSSGRKCRVGVNARSLCFILLKEVELIILNWTRSIESKVDTAIIFFRKMRGIYVHAAFAPTTGIRDRLEGIPHTPLINSGFGAVDVLQRQIT